MEEMAGNTFARGFAADRQKARLEIRVTHKENDVILRLRYNGIPFNPSEQVNPVQNGGGEAQMLMDSAKDVQYQAAIMLARGITQEIRYKNVLGLNNLQIRI